MKVRKLLFALAGMAVVLAFFSVLHSCKKDFPRQAAVLTQAMNKQTAVAIGKMIDLGQSAITDHGFCWDSSGFPSIDGKNLKLGKASQTGDFNGKLPGLLPNKVYYLKAYVISEEGAVYGNLLSFTTPDLPAVVTDSMKDITETTSISGGTVTSDGGSPVTGRGICWSETQNPDTTGLVYKDTITAVGSFSYQLTGLTGGKLYYVRAYATSLYGIRYANEVNFTSGQPITIPVVATTDVTNISLNSASSGGNVVSDGGASVTSRGVCWSTTPYPTIQSSKTADGAGIGTYSSSLTGLTANTTYYLRAYATNGIGTGYGDEKSFTTNPNPGFPTVITTTVTGITGTSASSGGTVLEDGGTAVTSRGVCWSSNPGPTTTNSKTSDGSGVGSFVSSITGLNAGTKYYVRAYAINNVGTSYGNETNFTAGQSITAPTITTIVVTNIAQTTVTCGGNVTSDGGASVTARGVCWGIFSSPTISNSHTTDGSGTGGFLSSIAGLFSSTAYYIRAYATNSAGTSYGNERQFTTLAVATIASVTTAPVTNITNNSATSGGTVTNDGGASVTARGVCWNTGNNPTITDPHTTNGTGTGNFVSLITGLQSNTFYRVRAYATNSVGTAYGTQQTFSTNQDPILPTVTTAAAINVTQTTATTGGTVMSDGGSPVTIRGVCYSTSPNPTTANSKTQNGSSTGTFVSPLTGLAAGTIYYVRAYAINSVGTAYGNAISFTTLTIVTLASVTTDPATNITSTTATCGGNVTSDGGSTVNARGVCWSTSSSPTIAGSHTTDGSGTGTFISNITGLTANTPYYVKAYATNSVGTAYGNEITFTTLWGCGISITVNHVTGTVAPVNKTVIYGTVTNIPGETSKCWITSNLGSDHQATAVDDATEASAGWYWQFNRKQGYKHDGTTRTPNTTWISNINESSNWITAKDPCNIELGSAWRIPTYTEWYNVDNAGGWTNWNGPWNSGLKLHAAGYLSYSVGSLTNRGSDGNHWSSTQTDATFGWYLYFYSSYSSMSITNKAYGLTLRCLRD